LSYFLGRLSVLFMPNHLSCPCFSTDSEPINICNPPGPKGAGRIAYVDGLAISGKTGTAQVVGHKKDRKSTQKIAQHLKAHAWFVAYAPSNDPQIAVVVMVEHGEHGSSTAAPIAREIIRTYLRKDTSIKKLAAQNSNLKGN